jgi:hypothetical protein
MKTIQILNFLLLGLNIIAIPSTILLYKRLPSIRELLMSIIYIAIQFGIILICKYKHRFARVILLVYSAFNIIAQAFIWFAMLSLLRYDKSQILAQFIYALATGILLLVAFTGIFIKSLNKKNFI